MHGHTSVNHRFMRLLLNQGFTPCLTRIIAHKIRNECRPYKSNINGVYDVSFVLLCALQIRGCPYLQSDTFAIISSFPRRHARRFMCLLFVMCKNTTIINIAVACDQVWLTNCRETKLICMLLYCWWKGKTSLLLAWHFAGVSKKNMYVGIRFLYCIESMTKDVYVRYMHKKTQQMSLVMSW